MSMAFSPESVAGFGALISEMERSTGRDTATVIRNVGRDFIRSAIRFTPIASRRSRRRGFAKPGWITALRGLGMTPVQGISVMAQRGGAQASRFGDYRGRLRGLTPSVELANQIPFIVELDRGSNVNPAHHILARAMMDTTVKMERALTRMSQRMARRWR